MKLVLTKQEAETAILSHFGLIGKFVNVVISKPKKSAKKSSVEELVKLDADLIALIGYIDRNAKTDRVAAIKSYRSYRPGIGLKEAKDVVDHWSQSRGAIISKGDTVSPIWDDGTIRFL